MRERHSVCLVFGSHSFTRRARAGVIPSISRPGNCYDNAAMESFWSSLKRELVHRCQFATRAEARAAIFEWIEVFYNRERFHSALVLTHGKMLPKAGALRAWLPHD